MKVVILAAGMGSRLQDPDTPKPLTLLANGKSLLANQLDILSQFLPLDNILIVVGYRKEQIMESHPDLLYVYNPHYATENTSKSLLKAIRKIDDDLLWLNGDVLVHPSILREMAAFNRTSMMVNVGPVAEEEVKYRCNSHGLISEVSKSVADARGEALGINLFKRSDLPALKQGLEQCADNDYFEKGIEWAIAHNTQVWSFPVAQGLCTEVDFPEDLEHANQMLQSW
ncbi:MAG: phosphocholine cytidylyltransferase family protein [Parachlamydia sp.]|nr:phosphocholine cytidylyltransferase family protein [Parachlamydia sp.]